MNTPQKSEKQGEKKKKNRRIEKISIKINIYFPTKYEKRENRLSMPDTDAHTPTPGMPLKGQLR